MSTPIPHYSCISGKYGYFDIYIYDIEELILVISFALAFFLEYVLVNQVFMRSCGVFSLSISIYIKTNRFKCRRERRLD